MYPSTGAGYLEGGGDVAEVLYALKTGKEAPVYCCRAAPHLGCDLVAAKVYKPRSRRSFKNDAVYQEGRYVKDARLRRAIKGKTRVGRQAQSSLWVSHEFEVLELLYAAGAAVPKPYQQAGEVILMEFLGDSERSAPMLHEVRVSEMDARRLYATVVRNVELWLSLDVVHADLSSFNILYWQGDLRFIDFPQAVNAQENAQAFQLLVCDMENIYRHFERFGVKSDPLGLAIEMWQKHQVPYQQRMFASRDKETE